MLPFVFSRSSRSCPRVRKGSRLASGYEDYVQGKGNVELCRYRQGKGKDRRVPQILRESSFTMLTGAATLKPIC